MQNQNQMQHQNKAVLTLNQEQAAKSGSQYINDSGFYFGTIKSATYIKAKTESKGIELSLSTGSGEANYLALYYEKKDGSIIESGLNMINAIMYLTGVNQLTTQTFNDPNNQNNIVNYAPELIGKQLGLVLRKTLYTKQDNTDGYTFEIVQAADSQQRTAKEILSNSLAETVGNLLLSLRDKDERTNKSQ